MVSATENVDKVPGPSKSWNTREVGGGAPDSVDLTDTFYVYYSSGGYTGVCQSLTSKDTEYGVKVKSRSHSIYYKSTYTSELVWNGTGTKQWAVKGTTAHVEYYVWCYGQLTYSTGTITRN